MTANAHSLPEIHLTDTLSGKKVPLGDPGARRGRDLLLRSDGLRHEPHRPRARRPGPRRDDALPAPAGLPGEYVRNITDIDDKIIKRSSLEEGRPGGGTRREQYTREYERGHGGTLGLLEPDVHAAR